MSHQSVIELLEEVKVIPNITQKRFEIVIGIESIVGVCEIVGITETVNLKVRYVPTSLLIETSSFRRAFKDKHPSFTFESFVSNVYDHLTNLLLPERLEVQVYRNDGKLIDWGVTYSNFAQIIQPTAGSGAL